MKFSGNNALKTGARGRFVLGVLLLAWLNIVTQPCLMAMEMAPEMSLGSEHKVHSEHAEHLRGVTGSTHCGHCPPGSGDQDVLCGTGSASSCELFPGYNVDGRQLKLQPEDLSVQFVLSTIDCPINFSSTVTLLPAHYYKRLKIAGDPPLNIRHCVFLK